MTESPRESVRRLGTFLADLTKDRRAERIHAEIIERLRDPSQALDHRLAGVYLQDKDFIPIWTAIRNGATLPVSSWETVVLPTVVHFSTEQTIKANLETAARLFLAARNGVAVPLPLDAAPGVRPGPIAPAPHLAAALAAAPDGPDAGVGAPPELEALFGPRNAVETAAEWHRPAPLPRGPRKRRWVPQATGLAIVAAAAVYLIDGPGLLDQAHSQLITPTAAVSPSATPEPSPSPSPEPSPSEIAGSPSPSMSSVTKVVPPSAPRSLASTAKTRTSVSLTWRAPLEPGTGGIERYRIFANGTALAWTDRTSETVLGLSAGTTYAFTVKAYSKRGLESPGSNTLTVKTDDPPPPAISAPPSVAYAKPFPVNGGNWRCAKVNVYLGTHLVAIPVPDAGGEFLEQIDVASDGTVLDRSTGTRFELSPGTWQVKASCGTLSAEPVNVTIEPKPKPV